MGATTKLKLCWLSKKKLELKQKVDTAYIRVRKELIEFINEYKGQPDFFVKYLAQALSTDDVLSFIRILDGVCEDAKKCKGDPEASRAIKICKYIKFRINLLSNFTIQWTNVKIRCGNCKRIVQTNFLYTDKLCPFCGNIALKD